MVGMLLAEFLPKCSKIGFHSMSKPTGVTKVDRVRLFESATAATHPKMQTTAE
jgi:hypothetical protein